MIMQLIEKAFRANMSGTVLPTEQVDQFGFWLKIVIAV